MEKCNMYYRMTWSIQRTSIKTCNSRWNEKVVLKRFYNAIGCKKYCEKLCYDITLLPYDWHFTQIYGLIYIPCMMRWDGENNWSALSLISIERASRLFNAGCQSCSLWAKYCLEQIFPLLFEVSRKNRLYATQLLLLQCAKTKTFSRTR